MEGSKGLRKMRMSSGLLKYPWPRGVSLLREFERIGAGSFIHGDA